MQSIGGKSTTFNRSEESEAEAIRVFLMLAKRNSKPGIWRDPVPFGGVGRVEVTRGFLAE